jgi:hypothetical protein
VYAQDYKVLLYRLPDLPTDQLGNAVIHCSDVNELTNLLTRYQSLKILIACTSDELIGLNNLLLNYLIDAFLVLDNDPANDFREWLDAPILNVMTVVQSERQLMRHLCTMIVLYYRDQATDYRGKQNEGMANLCILDSLKVLNCLTNFV